MKIETLKKYLTQSYFLKAYFYFGLVGMIMALIATAIYMVPGVNHPWLLLIGTFTTSDFMETLSYIYAANPYKGYWASGEERWTIYLPFAYMVLYPFALIAKPSVLKYINGQISLDYCYQDPLYYWTYLLYFVLHLVLILFLLGKWSKLKGKDLIYFLAASSLHSGVFFCFGRGNVMTTTFLFALIFFLYKDSDKWWVRELSYLALAGAIAIKIYPIILALVFIRERKFFALLRTAFYTASLVFLPFLLVEGGFSNIPLFVNNVLGFGSEGRGLGASNVSVDNFVAKFFWVLQQIFKADFSKAEKALSTILSGLVILTTVVLSFFPRKKGDVMPYTLLLIGCYLLFQTISYSYVFIFYTYVGLLLIQRWDELPFNRKALYVICLLILAQPFPLVWHLAFFGATANAILFGVSVYDLIKLLLRKEEAETALAEQTPSSIEEKAPKELGDNIA